MLSYKQAGQISKDLQQKEVGMTLSWQPEFVNENSVPTSKKHKATPLQRTTG
jgi:hypothetical protein